MDINEGSQVAIREFLAVVLAGFGNELLPLTSDYGDEPCPKALLPIGNRPMLDYPLSWLESSGIRDVLVICPASHRTAISHHIHSDSTSTSFSSLRIDLQTYDESQDLSVGTCAVLRHFASRIKDDFILLPCDFIPPPSLPLTTLLNKFRADVMSNGAIATACWFSGTRPEKGSIPEEWGFISTTSPIVWDERTGTLLHVDTPDDADRNSEELELRMGLLSQYPRTRLSSNLQDSHVYVCRRCVLDALQEKSHLDSFREEFIPWLCKVQYQRTKREKYGRILSPITNSLTQAQALRHSTTHAGLRKTSKHRNPALPSSPLSNSRDLGISAPASPADDDDDDTVLLESLRVGLVIHRADTEFAARANNLFSYLELNRRALANTTYSLPTDPENRALIDQKAQISQDSMIGDSTKIEERTTIKKSVIGKHCVIGKFVKIVGCIVLDHCVIADGAKLEGSILGKNTKVGAKADLGKCVTQAGYEVEAGESFRNEKLDVSDWTAGPVESDEDEEEGEGEGDDDVDDEDVDDEEDEDDKGASDEESEA
ncbi:hypothetical protein PLICRDRAFT_172390 [Plicaturopsis crispa FD-325 SS-3]|nr:hypothetical protein PLICRDRAFT_172390 [Plicaturopsis crispa FD-325 SS-3]